jgi:hypothetical protein
MVLMFFLFVINIIFIWYSKLPIIKAYFITALAVYVALNFANVDAIIARNNIDRYFKSGEIDMEYIKGLSYEAVPHIQRLAGDSDKGEEIIVYFKDKKQELKEQKSWQSLNYSRLRAVRIIDRYVK